MNQSGVAACSSKKLLPQVPVAKQVPKTHGSAASAEFVTRVSSIMSLRRAGEVIAATAVHDLRFMSATTHIAAHCARWGFGRRRSGLLVLKILFWRFRQPEGGDQANGVNEERHQGRAECNFVERVLRRHPIGEPVRGDVCG